MEISGWSKATGGSGTSDYYWSRRILLWTSQLGRDSKILCGAFRCIDDINDRGQTILMVTHSTSAASRAKRVHFIEDGILYNQIFRGDKTDGQMFQEISDTLTVMASEVGDYVQTHPINLHFQTW